MCGFIARNRTGRRGSSMNTQLERLESLCKGLRLASFPAEEIHGGSAADKSPIEMLISFLDYQNRHKQSQAATVRLRNARFPRVKTFLGILRVKNKTNNIRVSLDISSLLHP